ncbi:hypothetical protein EDB84DRAFT_1480927 [Lactarius hengduanensis]|nr:hypothetical protein EDB84DRAFT_1480927 [Lactarius hengduanensis]
MQEHCHLLFVFIPCVIHTFFKLHTLSRLPQGAYSYTHCGAHWHLGPSFFSLLYECPGLLTLVVSQHMCRITPRISQSSRLARRGW